MAKYAGSMIKERNGWLISRMDGKGEGWVAKKRDEWLREGMGG